MIANWNSLFLCHFVNLPRYWKEWQLSTAMKYPPLPLHVAQSSSCNGCTKQTIKQTMQLKVAKTCHCDKFRETNQQINGPKCTLFGPIEVSNDLTKPRVLHGISLYCMVLHRLHYTVLCRWFSAPAKYLVVHLGKGAQKKEKKSNKC